MRALVLALLAAVVVSVSPAAARPKASEPQAMPWRSLLEWRPKDGVVSYASGALRLTITPSDAGQPEDRVPVVTITRTGMAPVTLRGAPGLAWQFGIGQVDARVKAPAVLLQSFTGGAHCCSVIEVAVPMGKAYRAVRLRHRGVDGRISDMFDAVLDAFPIDLSGDGIADFVLTDDAFLYRFSSYAGSMPPPLVLNIRGGRTVDVSKAPGMRPLFLMKMAEARAYCTAPASQDSERNGACAGYVANAARTGQFATAWKLMLAHYDRSATWDRKPFPADLKALLRKNGYIR
ncbi:hypothetical protein ACNFJ7_11635 [Sphingomonas sp. HT-1]|uniref:hypothetical protein n=1 Tax=unclassified Sphingomonas TaxID=196159 RepID=UPI000A774F0A|nr:MULTISPECIES: hypothetical protein [unclassified Sphingomonas]